MKAYWIVLLLVLLGTGLHQPARAAHENVATPVSRITAPEGFKVELLYSVTGKKRGSWVALCHDPKGRIYAADQYGGLYRFPVPAPGQVLKEADIERVEVKVRAINGMLWAFDSLYVAVNDYERKMESGLYRITDTNADDQLDKIEKLRGMTARGDHGVHAILPGPDGKSLFLITGNNTEPTAVDRSRVPQHWGEDHLLPRMPDGRGHNRNRLAPAGIIYKISPDGKVWENYSSGYRNIYDGGFNMDGELFTYDADMEYDFNTSWYRPTRICHVTSGSMWGWRNGTGKRPEFYPDTLPPVINVGPGSPTGTVFGYGARFPAKYQKAFFILDWSWGKIHAVHIEPEGSSYTATKETFITGSPLPVTDIIVHPEDGAMYFAIGGRRVQSGLYRVTYHGDESVRPVRLRPSQNRLSRVRRRLEFFHGQTHPAAVKTAWRYLDDKDRFIRWAARTAIQHQPLSEWQDKALTEPNHGKRVEALLGLVKVAAQDPFHRQDNDPKPDKALQQRILKALGEVAGDKLNHVERLALVRTYQVCLVRFGAVDGPLADRIIAQLDPVFPAATFDLNWLLCETLAFLQAPSVAGKAIALMEAAPTQEEQLEYARSLRMLKAGWTPDLRQAYFGWFLKAANYHGGASFRKFIEFIRRDAVASLTDAERQEFKALLDKQPVKKSPMEMMAEALAGRSFVKEWSLEDLVALTQDANALRKRDYQNGRKMFGAVGCYACHRFNNEGGMTGPDLTGARGRYSVRDLLDQIVNPSREINEQFVPVVVTKVDGDTVTGVVVNLNGDNVVLNTDMFNPNQQVRLDRKQVKSMESAKVSPMPEGLLNLLKEEEVLDLMAYILSGGDAEDRMFR